VKKLTCSRSSPVLYGGALNIPWKKFSFPLPSGCVELPTTIRAARSTRGAEIEAGWVAATPATAVVTTVAAMPSAALLPRLVAALLIPTLPRVWVATYRVARRQARVPKSGIGESIRETRSTCRPAGTPSRPARLHVTRLRQVLECLHLVSTA